MQITNNFVLLEEKDISSRLLKSKKFELLLTRDELSQIFDHKIIKK